MEKRLLLTSFLMMFFLALTMPAIAAEPGVSLEPPTLKKISRNTTSIQVQSIANTNSDKLILCKAIVSYDATAQTVEIPADAEVGDTLNTGDVILYKGAALAKHTIDNLEANTVCHLVAYSYCTTPDYSFSTTGAELWDRTASALPIRWDTETFPTNGSLDSVPGFSSLLETNWSNYKFYQPCDAVMVPIGPKCFEATVNSGVPNPGLFHDSTDLILPAVLLEKGTHRLFFEKAFLVPNNMWGDPKAYRLGENDSLCVQISTTDTLNSSFKTIYTVNSLTFTEVSTQFSQNEAVFSGYNDQIVYIRFVFHSTKTVISRLNNFKIEKIKDCDYPASVKGIADSSGANSIFVGWEDNQEGATAWELQYKEIGASEWSSSLEVNTNPYRITGLPSDKEFAVRVRTVCSPTSFSDWSDPSPAVPTAYSLPFFCDFSKVQNSTANLPFQFASYKNNAGPFLGIEPSKLSSLRAMADYGPWKGTHWRSNFTLKRPSIYCRFESRTAALLTLPSLDIPQNTAPKYLSFDLSINDASNVGLSSVLINEGLRVSLLAITDTANFSINDTLITFGKESLDLNNIDSATFKVDITHLKGNVIFAFLVEHDSSKSLNAGAYITNVEVDYECAAPINLVSSHITDSSASLSWEFSKDAGFLVAYKKTADADYVYQNVGDKMVELKKLSSLTPYNVKVAALCSSTDTSMFATHTFTTIAPYICDTVSNMQVAIQTSAATISWEGSGVKYKLIWRKANTSKWDTIQTLETSVVLNNLEEGTSYEYAIQNQCSSGATDWSIFTSPRRFKTMYLTCHTPTDFKLVVLGWNSASFSYNTSDAQGVELLIRTTGAAAEILKFGLFDTITAGGLIPQTEYVVRLRSNCGGVDVSEYTDSIVFTTTDIPPCDAPTNLKSSIEDNNSAKLSWTSQGQTAWYLAYKEGSAKWDTLRVETPTHTLNDLKTNVLYSWKVQGECSKYLRSRYSEQATFTATGIDELTKAEGFVVYVSKNQLNVSNPAERMIDKLEIYNLQGQLIQLHEVGNNGNIILPLDREHSILIIKLYSQGELFTYKILAN